MLIHDNVVLCTMLQGLHPHTTPTHMILIKPKQWVIESIDRSTVRGAITRFVQLIRRSRIQLICRADNVVPDYF
jgi:hypothetical protein